MPELSDGVTFLPGVGKDCTAPLAKICDRRFMKHMTGVSGCLVALQGDASSTEWGNTALRQGLAMSCNRRCKKHMTEVSGCLTATRGEETLHCVLGHVLQLHEVHDRVMR